MAIYSTGTTTLYTSEQKAEINAQLGRLLESAHFSHSKRFPSFLRFIVEEELEGRGDQLKERTLGVVVFGRDPGYDTNTDPIVRVTAAEIRKRIAQYYQDTGPSHELRIALPAGSYIPHFTWNTSEATLPEARDVPHDPLLATPANVPPEVPSSRSIGRRFGAAHIAAVLSFIAVVGLLIAGVAWERTRPVALDLFWNPVLDSSNAVVVCFPRAQVDTIGLRSAANPENVHTFQEPASGISVDDLQPLVGVTGLLEKRQQRYTLVASDTATLTDLRHGSTIFLGAFDNAWTLRVTQGLRYRFGNDAEFSRFWIEDTQSPARWQIDRKQQMATNNYRDYAIVARFVDASTGHIAVVSAGIARGGTIAAGEFLTEAANMETIKSRAPRNWQGQNMELVLSTEIIDGRSAPPKIEATYFW